MIKNMNYGERKKDEQGKVFMEPVGRYETYDELEKAMHKLFKEPFISRIIHNILSILNRKKAMNYTGEIITSNQICRNLSKLLAEKNKLIILRHGGKPYKVVIGVPHHSSIGQSHICEEINRRDG